MIQHKRTLAGVWVLTLAACAPLAGDHPQFGAADFASRQARERAMNGDWQNRPLAHLLAARGEPTLVMNIPGGGNPPGFVVVYGPDPRTGCIDAYAINQGADPRVRIYHCR